VFPPHFAPAARDIVKRFLTADLSSRLGNLQGGSEDVKNHAWFAGIVWDDILNRKIQAPIVPVCAGPGDARNFEIYSEEIVNSNDKVPLDPFQHYFAVHVANLGILIILSNKIVSFNSQF
jgi:hypothetical protein